jgi:phosphoribosylglycinamide formyltransferase 1
MAPLPLSTAKLSGHSDIMRVAILISGRGSNMDALLTAANKADVEIALVAANKPCSGLERAAAAGYKTALIDRSDYDSKLAHEAALDAVLLQAAPDWIFLAGYMALLSAAFIARQHHKIINIHPSLLPAYKGLNTHQRAIDDGAEFHGVSIHLVTAGMDEGDVMVQAGLKIGNADTAEILAQRLLVIEHLLYPAVLRALHSERMKVSFTPGGVDCLWLDRSDLPRIGQAEICLIKTP